MNEKLKARLLLKRKKSHFARLVVVGVFFACMLLALIVRIVDLTILHRQFLQGQGNARSLRIIDIPAYRGMITDRNRSPLAVSTQVLSVFVNPKVFAPDANQLKQLTTLLKISPKAFTQKVANASNREFLYVKRQLPPALAKKIQDLQISGVNFQQEFKRYYPEGDTLAQLLGFTNVDDQGLEGLELAYQDWLMGLVGKKRVVKDRIGNIIEELQVIKEPRAGRELRISIDRRLQYLAYNELMHTIDTFGAKSGTVVVLDTKKGEILALANAPSYNPNARGSYPQDSYRNRAATDLFEPGSVIKAFSIASALESGLYKPDTIIDTNPSYMTVHGRTVRDIHNYGVLDVTGVLQHSSNVGVAKMVLASPPEQFINLLERVGFGQRTESACPGESDGTLLKVKDANPFMLATLGFGYGLSVTALQLAKAYAVFANGGMLIPITLIHNDTQTPGVRVMQEKTANQLLTMMEAVVAPGSTGKDARVPGYRVAGKTGTSRIAGKNGYAERKYIASFIGIAPVSNPQFVVVVVIQEPTRKSYYAAAVAAPLFSKVMGYTLRIFNVLPDDPSFA